MSESAPAYYVCQFVNETDDGPIEIVPISWVTNWNQSSTMPVEVDKRKLIQFTIVGRTPTGGGYSIKWTAHEVHCIFATGGECWKGPASIEQKQFKFGKKKLFEVCFSGMADELKNIEKNASLEFIRIFSKNVKCEISKKKLWKNLEKF